jgi:spore coat protein SA
VKNFDIERKRRLRILVIAPDKLPIPPVKGGSVETCIDTIFRRMARKDNVTIVSSTHPRLPKTSVGVRGKLRIVRFPYPNSRTYLRAALRKMRRKRFDVIQVENRPTFVPAVRRAFPRTPIVLSLHSLTFLSRLSKKRADAVIRQVNGVTCVVSFVAGTYRKQFPQHAHKIKEHLLGVDTEKFKPRSAAYKRKLRRRWGVDGSFNLLFVGRIIRRKGLHTLVKAAALLKKRYPNVQIVAVGASWHGVKKETPYMRQVRLLARKLGVPIRFTGYILPRNVHKMYHLGDIFVCPTQFREGFAMVNSEAMASGVPIVASRRGGIVEVVRSGKDGLLVSDYRSPAAFAKAIRRIRSNPGLARRLAAGGRKRVVSRFSWSNTVSSLRRYYRTLK